MVEDRMSHLWLLWFRFADAGMAAWQRGVPHRTIWETHVKPDI
jgi:hypothetical protein